MKEQPKVWRDRSENDILFSRVVKAGKRVYYIDVKRDRNDEFYLSMTESKRVREGSETERPAFEKHKIFLYREDILKFLTALTDAAQFVGENRSLAGYHEGQDPNYVPTDLPSEATLSSEIDIEF